MVKNLPAMQETQVPSLGGVDPLEKGMATHSNILAWRIPWTEKPHRLQSMGLHRVKHDYATNIYLLTFAIYNITLDSMPGSLSSWMNVNVFNKIMFPGIPAPFQSPLSKARSII